MLSYLLNSAQCGRQKFSAKFGAAMTSSLKVKMTAAAWRQLQNCTARAVGYRGTGRPAPPSVELIPDVERAGRSWAFLLQSHLSQGRDTRHICGLEEVCGTSEYRRIEADAIDLGASRTSICGFPEKGMTQGRGQRRFVKDQSEKTKICSRKVPRLAEGLTGADETE